MIPVIMIRISAFVLIASSQLLQVMTSHKFPESMPIYRDYDIQARIFKSRFELFDFRVKLGPSDSDSESEFSAPGRGWLHISAARRAGLKHRPL